MRHERRQRGESAACKDYCSRRPTGLLGPRDRCSAESLPMRWAVRSRARGWWSKKVFSRKSSRWDRPARLSDLRSISRAAFQGPCNTRPAWTDPDTSLPSTRTPTPPIFEIADFAIVGDLFEILPALTRAVRGDGVIKAAKTPEPLRTNSERNSKTKAGGTDSQDIRPLHGPGNSPKGA